MQILLHSLAAAVTVWYVYFLFMMSITNPKDEIFEFFERGCRMPENKRWDPDGFFLVDKVYYEKRKQTKDRLLRRGEARRGEKTKKTKNHDIDNRH